MINKPKKTDMARILTNIGTMFDKLNEKRQSQLNDIKAVQEAIFGLNVHPKSAWHSALKLPNIYEQHQTMKAHLMENIYSTPESLFEIESNNFENPSFAIKQKSMLIDVLRKINIEDKIEKMIDNIIISGECTLFIGWKEIYKSQRRRCEGAFGEFETEKIKVFEGADVKTISPADFVFDADMAQDFTSSNKIFRTYQTIDEIKSDKNNTFEDTQTLKALEKGANASSEQDFDDKSGFKGGRVEVLEFWGDIDLGDNKIFKNYFVVVAGRQTILRFEPNPYVECPFIYGNIIENPITKRGVSPLKSVLALNTITEEILNHQLDAYSLLVNPPYLAPKGAFKGVQEVYPGKIIEYDSSLLPQMPAPLAFSGAINGWDFVEFFKKSIEETTGIYRTMTGAISDGARTATEINYTLNGAGARLNLTVDSINRKLILPMIEKISDTIANFKIGSEIITATVDGKTVIYEIDDKTRQMAYTFKYSDKKGAMERRWRQRELTSIINLFSKIPEFSNKINWKECFKLALEGLGVDNFEKFLTNFKE